MSKRLKRNSGWIMDESKKNLEGSPSRDKFKMLHKQFAPKNYYACDLDFILVAKYPARIIACLDFKLRLDKITFAEVVAYNELVKYFPIYIITGKDAEHGPFVVEKYIDGDEKPEPPVVEKILIRQCETWDDLADWEKSIRL